MRLAEIVILSVLLLPALGPVRTLSAGETSLPEKGSDPLEASRFHYVFGLAGEGQTPFRTGSKNLAFESEEHVGVREGYVSLRWNEVPDAIAYEVLDSDDRSHYRGVMREAFISGLPDGTHRFRVLATGPAGEVLATSQRPAVVVVEHWPVGYAMGLFSVGLVVVAGVITVIIRGALENRGGEA